MREFSECILPIWGERIGGGFHPPTPWGGRTGKCLCCRANGLVIAIGLQLQLQQEKICLTIVENGEVKGSCCLLGAGVGNVKGIVS